MPQPHEGKPESEITEEMQVCKKMPKPHDSYSFETLVNVLILYKLFMRLQDENKAQKLHHQHKEGAPPLSRLMHLTDWIPSKRIRSVQRKMLADEAAEIADLMARGEKKLVVWRSGWVWVNWTRYLISVPCLHILNILWKTVT